MTSRILPREEYGRLQGTEAGEVVWPSSATVVVVEDQGEIVGCHVLQAVLHAECLWIHPDHRGKSSVPRRLWSSVQQVVRQLFHAESFWTATTSDDVTRLLTHVGATAIPGAHYIVPVRGQ